MSYEIAIKYSLGSLSLEFGGGGPGRSRERNKCQGEWYLTS